MLPSLTCYPRSLSNHNTSAVRPLQVASSCLRALQTAIPDEQFQNNNSSICDDEEG
jgi:hypothetical protein